MTDLDATSSPAAAPLTRAAGAVLACLAAVGLLAAAVLTIEKVQFLAAAAAGETASSSCDVNAFVSCSSVFSSAQAEVFGFPNPLIGIAGFPVVIVLGVLAAAGVRMPRGIWWGLAGGAFAGIVFVTWLQFQSIYVLTRLCPWCMVVWAVMIPIFVMSVRAAATTIAPDGRVARVSRDWAGLVISLWVVAIGAAIWFRFGTTLWA